MIEGRCTYSIYTVYLPNYYDTDDCSSRSIQSQSRESYYFGKHRKPVNGKLRVEAVHVAYPHPVFRHLDTISVEMNVIEI